MNNRTRSSNTTERSETSINPMLTEHEGNFDLVEFADVPEPMVAAHIPMQED